MDISTATPVEIDTALAEIYQRYYAALDKVALFEKYLADYVQGNEKRLAGNLQYSSYTQERVDEYDAKVQDAEAEAQRIYWETLPYQAEFDSRPWTRFFHVTNSNGHIHSSMSCSTCFPTTRYAWLTEMSGMTEDEALEMLGKQNHVLCSVCFPNAPVWMFEKRQDPSVCPGSGTTDYDRETARTGYYTGNGATCDHCGQWVTIPGRSIKLRKHKKDA